MTESPNIWNEAELSIRQTERAPAFRAWLRASVVPIARDIADPKDARP